MIASIALALLLAPAPVQGGGSPAEVIEDRDPDGTLRARRTVIRGPDGGLVLHGAYERFGPDGVVLESGNFESGRPDGKWLFRHPNGQVAARGAFDDGLAHGGWSFRHPNAQIQAEGKYEHGWRVGRWSALGDDGSPDELHSGTYAHALEHHRAPGGHKRCEGQLLDGRPHGPWRTWWRNGAPQLEGAFLRGAPAATWRFWHGDGTPDAAMLAGTFGEAARAAQVEPRLPTPMVAPIAGEQPPRAAPAPLDLASALALEPLADDATLRARLLELAEGAALGERTRALAEAAVVDLGRGAIGVLVEALVRVDPATADGERRGGAIQSLLASACGGRSYGWTPSIAPTDVAANRLAMLRWASLWSVMGDVPAFWEFQMRTPPASPTSELLDARSLARGLVPRTAPARTPELDRDVARAVERALAWLAAHQMADGSWDSDGFAKQCSGGKGVCGGPGREPYDVGVTALALRALVEGGSDLEGGPYCDNVSRALAFLVRAQERKSGLIGAKRTHEFLYAHGIAVLALCEAARRTPEWRSLLGAAEPAVRYVERACNPHGAWRYDVPPAGDNDTSVTAWMVSALDAARAAGLGVDPTCFERADAWMREVTDPETGRVGYDSFGSRSARTVENEHYPREHGEAMTAAGLYMRLLLADARGTPLVPDQLFEKQMGLLLHKLPVWSSDGFTNDVYYWYYGARALARVEDRRAKAWLSALRKAALGSQRKDGHAQGSWDPNGPWGYAGGRVYSTSMLALALLALDTSETRGSKRR